VNILYIGAMMSQ